MSTARDISIIILAVESIVVGVMLAILIIQLQRLIKMLQEEIKPVIDSTNETVSAVRGTTTFLSEHLVSPIIGAAGYVAGLKRAAQVMTNWPKGESVQTSQASRGIPSADVDASDVSATMAQSEPPAE